MTNKKTAIVVGAGMGGLTAAYRLQQAGYKVTVFEKLPYAAGRARTVKVGDCIIDAGATVVLSAYDQTLALIEELGLSNQLVEVGGNFAVPRDGKMHLVSLDNPVAGLLKTPLLGWYSKLSLIKLLPKLLSFRKHFNFYNLGAAAGTDDETLEQFCRRSFPAEVYEYFLNPMIKFLYIHSGHKGSLVELLWWMSATGTGATQSFKYGTNTLTDKLATLLDLRCNSEVVEVTRSGDGVAVVVQSSDGKRETISADYCLITTPAPVTAKIYRQGASTAAQDFMASREYEKVIVVSFCTSKRPILDALMVEVPDSFSTDLATIVFQHRVASTRAPADKGVVNAYFSHDWSSTYFAASDEEILKAAQMVVKPLVAEVDELDGFHIQHWEYNAALSEVGACAKIRQFVENSDPASPIQLIGDYLAEASINVAVTTANRAVEQLIRQAKVQ
jgi:protoporphyrinogen/coproporphyrinogen III oxidase